MLVFHSNESIDFSSFLLLEDLYNCKEKKMAIHSFSSFKVCQKCCDKKPQKLNWLRGISFTECSLLSGKDHWAFKGTAWQRWTRKTGRDRQLQERHKGPERESQHFTRRSHRERGWPATRIYCDKIICCLCLFYIWDEENCSFIVIVLQQSWSGKIHHLRICKASVFQNHLFRDSSHPLVCSS